MIEFTPAQDVMTLIALILLQLLALSVFIHCLQVQYKVNHMSKDSNSDVFNERPRYATTGVQVEIPNKTPQAKTETQRRK
jgi:ABC-type nickel/cobalt efflux system permease component RcnA